MSNIDHEFSVIGLSETWLTPSDTDAFGIAGYNHVAVTRQAKKGGGVSLFISEKLVYSDLKELNVVEDYLEYVFVKIVHDGNLIIIGTVYRPPNSNVIDFNDAMKNIWGNRSSRLLYYG